MTSLLSLMFSSTILSIDFIFSRSPNSHFIHVLHFMYSFFSLVRSIVKMPSLVILVVIFSGFLFNLVNFEQKVEGVKGVFFVAFDDLSFCLGWVDVSVPGVLQQKTFLSLPSSLRVILSKCIFLYLHLRDTWFVLPHYLHGGICLWL